MKAVLKHSLVQSCSQDVFAIWRELHEGHWRIVIIYTEQRQADSWQSREAGQLPITHAGHLWEAPATCAITMTLKALQEPDIPSPITFLVIHIKASPQCPANTRLHHL